MNKVLFVTPSFRNGGTVSCLKSLLPFLRQRGFEVDLFALTPEGPNYDTLRKSCNILSSPFGGNISRAKSVIIGLAKLIKHILANCGIDISRIAFSSMVNKLERNNYDWIVAFQEETVTEFVSFFNTDNLIAWVHCDYTRLLNRRKESKDFRIYKKYHRIVFVSQYTKNRFISIYPQLASASVAIHNFVFRERIREMSLAPLRGVDACDENMILISLGRIDPVKRFTAIPSIAKGLKNRGLVFRWYIVGGGDNNVEKDQIREEIIRNEVLDNVAMIGNLDNPFPLLKKARLLVCTSMSEAYPNVVQEAIALGVPSVITDFGSAEEVIVDGYNGYICPIDDVEKYAFKLMSDDQLYERVKTNCENTPSENSFISEQLMELFKKDTDNNESINC